MGKSKKRNFHKSTDELGSILKRDDVIFDIISDIKSNKLSDKTQKLINLFGITAEELSEAGASFEEISSIKQFIY
ncbi:MAG: hypothetical protein E7Z90_00055 [Cyanobacteria bacterium SIG29]|nr:hypothetical protein [Cyanobacteria bacterium SIG29]